MSNLCQLNQKPQMNYSTCINTEFCKWRGVKAVTENAVISKKAVPNFSGGEIYI